MYTLGSYTLESWLHQLTLMWARRGPEAGNLSITSSKHNWMALKCSCKLNMNSLVPSHPHPPVENVWWIDLNFLWLAPCEMSNGIAERTIKDCYVIKVQNGHLDFILRFATFVQKRELCESVLCRWATTNLLTRKFASLCEERTLPAVLVQVWWLKSGSLLLL